MVNQLASAFEQQLLTKGSSVRLVVGGGGEGGGEGGEEGGEAAIKLVVTSKGGKVNVGRMSTGQTLSRHAAPF